MKKRIRKSLWVLLWVFTLWIGGSGVPLTRAQDDVALENQDEPVLAASNVKRTIWRRRDSNVNAEESLAGEMPAAEESQMPEEMIFSQPMSDEMGAAAVPTATIGGEAASSSGEAQGDQTKISLEIKGMDILDVLKLLAKKSGLNIVAGRNVRGSVTIFLKDVEVWDALLIILETYDLAYEKKNDMIKVMTDADYQKLHGTPFHDIREVKFVTLEHAKAAEVSQALNLVKTKVGKIIIDDRTNMLALIDAPEGNKAMMEIIEQMDIAVVTKVFALRHVDVLTIEQKIKDMLSPAGKQTSDIPTNKIIVVDSATHVTAIEKLVGEYDVPMRLLTRVYPLNYATFSEVEAKVTEILTKDVGKIIADERTSTIAVTDLVDNIARIDHLVEVLDKQDKQVLIDAKIIQVEFGDNTQVGINWEALFEKELGGLELKNLFSKSLTAGGSLGFGVIDGAGVVGAIQVLKTIGDTNILAEPRIMTINNKPATIHVGTNEAFITSDVTQNDNTTTITPHVEFQQVGIKLNVTPRINNESFIVLEIKPEVSSVARTVELFNDSGQKISEVPVVRTSETETTVLIKSGKTVVIGGLIDDSLIKTENRIPILGALPGLGMFFRNREKDLSKSELVVFVTPTIIDPELKSQEPAESEHERMLRLKEIMKRMEEYKNLREQTNAKLMI